jgi:hypothetical protein
MSYYTAGRNAHSDRQFDPYVLHFSRLTPGDTAAFCHLRRKKPVGFGLIALNRLKFSDPHLLKSILLSMQRTFCDGFSA